MKLKNKYFAIRHGEAISNVKNIVSSLPEKFHNPLTEDGKEKIKKEAEALKHKNVDLIFASPLLRTKMTAEIISKETGAKIKFDKRLREIGFGTLNGKTAEEFARYFDGLADRIKNKTPRGESYTDVAKRMFSFLKEINAKFKGKNILVVSHQAPILLLRAKLEDGKVLGNILELKNILAEKRVTKGELIELN